MTPVRKKKVIPKKPASPKTIKRTLEENLSELFEMIGDSLPQIFWVNDGTGKQLYVSPGFQKLWGQDPASKKTKTFLEAVLPEDREMVLSEVKARQESGYTKNLSTEYRIRRPNGEICWIWDRAYPLLDKKGKVWRVIGVAQDVTLLKNTSQELQDTSELLYGVAEKITEAFWVEDLAAKKTYVSPGIEKIWGKPIKPGDSLWTESLHKEDRNRISGRLKTIRGSGYADKAPLEYRIVRPNGDIRWVSERVFPMQTTSGTITRTIGFVEDITAKKLSQDALNLQTRELQATLSIALTLAQPGDSQENMMLALKKLAEFADCEECILRIPSGTNLVAHAFYHGPPFVGNNIRESIPIYTNATAAGQAYLQRKPSVVNDYENYPYMLQSNLEKGYRSLAAVPIVIGTQSLGVIAIVSTKKDHFTKARIDDISAVSAQLGPFLENARLNEELKAKEKAIQMRSEQLETMLNMARILSQPGSFKERAKNLVEEISEITKSDTITLRLFDAYNELLREVVSVNNSSVPVASPPTTHNQGLAAEAVSQGKIIVSNDYLNEPVPKNPFAVAAGLNSGMFVPIKVGGKVVGTMNLGAKEKNHFTLEHILFLTAVSDELGAMLENARLTEEIAVNRELEKRTQTFISMASHELRTPLTAMLGFAELLREHAPLEDEQKEWLNIVNEQGQRLATIVDDMLSVSKIRSGTADVTPEAFSLREMLQKQVDILSKTSNKHRFEISVPPTVTDIVADKEKVARVLNNLITNAIKYSPRGGAVKISVLHEPVQKRVVISVQDEGIGVSADDRDRIFSVFQRVSRPETRDIPGSGLGLYIVKGLLDLMHGNIWMDSELNKGSTFYFSLPIS